MTELINAIKRERTRAYLYRLAVGAGGVAFFYGLLSAEEVAVWSGLVATAFVLPAVNTSTERKPYEDPH